jgi:hypothetical protein
MSASSLPGTSGLAALKTTTGSSTRRSGRGTCNAPRSDTGIKKSAHRPRESRPGGFERRCSVARCCEAVRTHVALHHFPAHPRSIISPQNMKLACFGPRFVNSGIDLRIPLSNCREPSPWHRLSSNESAASGTANRCLIVLITNTTGWFRKSNYGWEMVSGLGN